MDRALVYRRYPDRPEILRFWERQMISKHLRRLQSGNVVCERRGRFMRRDGPPDILFCLDDPGKSSDHIK